MGMNNTTCCGIKEYFGIHNSQSPEAALKDIGNHLFKEGYERSGLVFFSDNLNGAVGSPGYAVQKYIEEHKLGNIICTNPKVNKNSGNLIVMWVWEYDRVKFKNWFDSPQLRDRRHYGRGALVRWHLKRIAKRQLFTLPTFAKLLKKA